MNQNKVVVSPLKFPGERNGKYVTHRVRVEHEVRQGFMDSYNSTDYYLYSKQLNVMVPRIAKAFATENVEYSEVLV